MGGKAKIEGLTNSWYGFAVFSAICSVLIGGIGFFSIGAAVVGLLFSWVVTFFFGRALVGRSSLVRMFLLCFSGLFMVLGVLGTASSAWSFMTSWELSKLTYAGYTAVLSWMYARSFRTLTDSSVKAYFN